MPLKRTKAAIHKRPSSFKPSHKLTFGLAYASHSPNGYVKSVSCWFCVTFGRQESSRVKKTSRRAKHNKVFDSFRTDLYLKHLEDQHAQRWRDYEKLSPTEKVIYFNKATQQSETINAYFGLDDVRVYRVHRDIINGIVKKMLTGDSFRSTSFDKVLRSDESVYFSVTIENSYKFDATLGYVALGMSFRTISKSVQVARSLGHISQFHSVSEEFVRMYVQAIVAINLEKIRGLISDRRCWAYSIAFDGASNRGDSYVDVRLRFTAKGTVKNVHGLAIPILDSHTGENIYDIVKRFLLHLLGEKWNCKLISVATDGARNMTGRLSGVVSRFERDALQGLFHIWCATHQLDLIIQDLMTGILQFEFRSTLNSLIAHLRRQYSLRQEMGSTCPAVAATRWLSLGKASNWISRHRATVSSHLEDKNPSLLPSTKWWVLLSAIKYFMNAVDICCKSLQGRDVVAAEQNTRIENLATTLKSMAGISDALDSVALLAVADDTTVVSNISNELGTSIVHEEDIVGMLEDSSMKMEEDIYNLAVEERQSVLKTVADMFLTCYVKVLSLQAERSSTNGRTEHVLPPILPHQLVSLRPREFFNIVKSQKVRLLETWTSADLVGLEDQFRSFEEHVAHSSASRSELEKFEECIAQGCDVFGKAWSTFYSRFPQLVQFCGEMASVFPGTITVESDFSVLQWEKDEHRANLTNLS